MLIAFSAPNSMSDPIVSGIHSPTWFSGRGASANSASMLRSLRFMVSILPIGCFSLCSYSRTGLRS